MIHQVVHLNTENRAAAYSQALYALLFAAREALPQMVFVRIASADHAAIGAENLKTFHADTGVHVLLNENVPAGELQFLDFEQSLLGRAGVTLMPDGAISTKGGTA